MYPSFDIKPLDLISMESALTRMKWTNQNKPQDSFLKFMKNAMFYRNNFKNIKSRFNYLKSWTVEIKNPINENESFLCNDVLSIIFDYLDIPELFNNSLISINFYYIINKKFERDSIYIIDKKNEFSKEAKLYLNEISGSFKKKIKLWILFNPKILNILFYIFTYSCGVLIIFFIAWIAFLIYTLNR